MDFARKQLEKFGWKDGDGLGKECQGISVAIKPHLKKGKEGMGFDLNKELTDTWYTKAYSDCLKNISVTNDEEEGVRIISKDDEDVLTKSKRNKKKKKKNKIDESSGSAVNKMYLDPLEEERPMEKMRRKMMKANFTSFSKGGTLTNGELVSEKNTREDEKETPTTVVKVLTDEELLKACGGRTLHKAARFGHKLNGKLARIAAQEEEEIKYYLSKSNSNNSSLSNNNEEVLSYNAAEKSKKRKKKNKKVDEEKNNEQLELTTRKKKKLKIKYQNTIRESESNISKS